MHQGRENDSACNNCGASLRGRWCHQCGQKRLESRDRQFGHLLGQFAHELFHSDGKLPSTFGALLFRPGKLTRAYLDGQRVRYLKPIALFLLINLIYFLAPPLTDFNLDLQNQLSQPYGELIQPLVEARAEDRYSPMSAFHDAYDQRVHRIAKLLIILHLPLLALVLLLLFPRRRMFYAEHFIIATYMFSFFLAVLLIVSALLGIVHVSLLAAAGTGLSAQASSISQLIFLLLVATGWLVYLRQSYSVGWLRSLVSLVGWIVGFLLLHVFIYRPIQFFLVLLSL